MIKRNEVLKQRLERALAKKYPHRKYEITPAGSDGLRVWQVLPKRKWGLFKRRINLGTTGLNCINNYDPEFRIKNQKFLDFMDDAALEYLGNPNWQDCFQKIEYDNRIATLEYARNKKEQTRQRIEEMHAKYQAIVDLPPLEVILPEPKEDDPNFELGGAL